MTPPPASLSIESQSFDLICLSHLRWNFVFQRPQHLMSRYGTSRRVFFVEEPIVDPSATSTNVVIEKHDNVFVVVPHIPATYSRRQATVTQRALLDWLIRAERIEDFVLWYYTPNALAFSSHLMAKAIVYDCMDELSAFKHASPELPALEKLLLRRAHVVFTGGQSLYEAKRRQHHNIHALPSSVDVAHFAKARTVRDEPHDQARLPRPRLGFFGVIDERFDIPLLASIADARPSWQFVMIGPVVKIDRADLPDRPNIHYVGPKTYDELPAYAAGWDVALLLFARNEATRYISPTKTPEYLAAGKPVVSTSIRDVVSPYGDAQLVRIADTVDDFLAACGEAIDEPAEPRRRRADRFLKDMSWDRTWQRTAALLSQAVAENESVRPPAQTLAAQAEA